jgi:intraflagellar transport protein 172
MAEKYFALAGRPQDAVDMYTKANKWEKAHALATSYMSSEEVAFLYVSQAREMEADGKLKEAEKLYLTVGEPDLAINMYKNHKHYDHMIRLVTAYHKDLLVETHLYLGKTLETEGNFKQAEHHYIEGKDWKAAINMYCANNSYEDAYRVAKSFGGPNSAKQVAYLWARSLGGESAVKLLTKFGLLEAAIDFATENGAFEFAFELSRFADKFKLADVHYKHAMYLEDEGKFKEAENAFILASKPKEAILMYIHNENWEAALSVADTYDPSSVPEVLIGQAKASFDRKEYASAETLLLRAQRPDLAIKFYKDNGLWKEAMQFAKEYLPNKLAEIHEEYNRFLSSQSHQGSNGKEEMLSTARLLEQQRDFSRAIDMYLKFNIPQYTDYNFLEDVWEKAVEIAMKFVPERGREVVTAVCSRLVSIKRYEQAAEFYAGVEMYREAIDAYASGGLWDKAKEIVRMAPKLADYLDATYVSHLKSQGHADALVSVDVTAGLELFAKRGDWEKCLETAANHVSYRVH